MVNVKKFNFSDLKKNPDTVAQEQASIVADRPFNYFGIKEVIEEKKYTDSDIKVMASEAFDKGYKQAASESEQTNLNNKDVTEARLGQLFQNIINKLEHVIVNHNAHKKQFEETCVQLAGHIAKKIAGEALKEEPNENITKIFDNSLKLFFNEEIVYVKVNPKYQESLNSRFSKIAIQRNFSGKIVFIPDAKIEETDCLIEWGVSGVSLNNSEVIQKVDELINEYCKSINNGQ